MGQAGAGVRILTSSAMREVDRSAIEDLGIPSVVLMENAALGVVEAVCEQFPEASTAAVYCGPGNNGGDGFAIARHLMVRGFQASVVVATGGREYDGDAALQLEILRNMGVDPFVLAADEPVGAAIEKGRSAEVVIDALFGTGLSRALDGQFAQLVLALNELAGRRVAVDLPSGLSGDTGRLLGHHVEADLTVTFAAPKFAHVFSPAASAMGTLVVTDLGIPEELVERAPGDVHLLDPSTLAVLLPPRPATAHKGDFGHVLIVAGAEGTSGAAILAARAAVRSGAGLVTAAVPQTILSEVETGSIESMSVGVPQTDSEGLGNGALEAWQHAAAGKTVVALGPGIGTEGRTPATVRAFCQELDLPLVLDADGVNAYAGRAKDLSARAAPTILTPHPGELARLLGVDAAAIEDNRLESVRKASEQTGAVVVLKGHLSLVADPTGGVYVNPTGNAGMATGGSGDVLTGMIAALLGQGVDALAAAQLGTYVHGLAGDLAAEDAGELSLAASDLLAELPKAFQQVLGGRAR